MLSLYTFQVLQEIFNQPGTGYYQTQATGLIHKQCFGCQFLCPSQRDHNICLLPFYEQIEQLFEFAIAEIEERKISYLFAKEISEANPPLANITSNSPFSYFMDEEWRQKSFLTDFSVYSEIMDKAVCEKHLEREEIQAPEKKRSG